MVMVLYIWMFLAVIMTLSSTKTIQVSFLLFLFFLLGILSLIYIMFVRRFLFLFYKIKHIIEYFMLI